jgi:hypothetical protein
MSHKSWVRAPQGVMCLWILLLATAWTLRAWNCVGIFPRGHFFPRRRLPPLQIAFVRERCAFNARRTPTARTGARTISIEWGLKLTQNAHVRKEMQRTVSHMYVFHMKYIGFSARNVFLHKHKLILMLDVR